MDKDSRVRWLRDCEQCQGDTKKVLKILKGGTARPQRKLDIDPKSSTSTI
ncbi:hypothetical protein I568_01936 [Enterococcus columbae DSM 7374 = ATCC 51263]|uniref:Uncharacterized protein n=1 Tax=Enterococcus columbae DSM 7374 = ATCC 51263 TaxID=1121865 RepID=S0KHQ0_9ENTE|nr:hypothetical protein OMW_01322 [Enterococcus columbae DSM 7374 = ATCC 51263]EOW80236.1 hypothetical protein I568_01936 [Enterococcus columbae DSM 7374 = ATCC 51263]